jgi:hypothetical protein
MRKHALILAGPAAITLMIFYYFIPFQIVAGAPNSLGKLRPFVLSASAMLIAFGFYRLWQEKQSKSESSMRAKWTFSLSAVVVCWA